MSETNQFFEYKPQIKTPRITSLPIREPLGFGIDKRRNGLDLISSGEGMLATEAMRNAPGLTPLSFDVDVHNMIRNRGYAEDELSTTEGKEKIRNSSGLSIPLSFRGEFHKRGVK
jgi:hypothetical protein